MTNWSINKVLIGTACACALTVGVAACGGSSTSATTAAPTTTPAAVATGAPTDAQVISDWNSRPKLIADAAQLVTVAANSGETYQCSIGTVSADTATAIELYVPGSTDMPSAEFDFNAAGTATFKEYAAGTVAGTGGDVCSLNANGTITLG